MDMKELAEKGQEIYNRRYRAKLEESHTNKFAAIDIQTEKCYIGNMPEEAIQKAKKESPNNLLHLIRIGHTGVYRMSTLSNADYQLF